MRIKTVCIVVGTVGLLPLTAQRAFSQQEGVDVEKKKMPEGTLEMSPEMMAGMAEWMKLAQPGEHHKKLDFFAGKWNTATKIYWGGPGTTPMESQGTATFKWVLGERFLMKEYRGTFMGQPFEGLGFLGYDNYKNIYVANWMDNQGTVMLTSKGQVDPSGKVFTTYGEMDEPMLKVQDRMVKYLTRIINENKFVFEIFDLHAGEDYRVIEIVHTRRGS